jgi:prevent-host-death family protein
MSVTIESFEAQSQLPDLLERVARGETITITAQGKPVAQLTPVPSAQNPDVRNVVQEMLAYRDQRNLTLGGITARDLIEEGRRDSMPPEQKPDVRKVIEEFKAYSKREGRTLGSLTYRDLVEEGRRF